MQIVEYRKITENNYYHYILGKIQQRKKQSWLNNLMNKFMIESKNPKENEVLDTSSTIKIFQSFYESHSIPEEFTLRDISKYL
ncbi:hypothetical protein [Shimazuella kribbensis]|uniref:hypothetical protein n=1 Tax=Shimazuella kribbensis TaxID=139808 RepID=UPI0003FE0B98|nr:hypothetical protein [Shimazuella kribbensis]